MAGSELLEREQAVSEMVRRYASGREAAAEVFVLGQAETDFSEPLDALLEAKSQAARLRARDVPLALTSGRSVASLVARFIASVEADVGAVADRADVHRAL